MTLAIGNNVEILVYGDAGDAHYAELMRAWRWTNSLLQAKVKDIVATLPTGATEGDVYIVTGGSMPNQLARWTTRLSTAAWEYMVPKAGWEVRVQSKLDSAGLPKTHGYTGTTWVEKPGGSGSAGDTGGGTSSTGGDVFATKTPASGVLDISATTANLWGVNLNQNVSSVTLPTSADVFSMSVIFTQDSTGSRSVTWPSKVTWTNGTFSLNTAANSKTIVSLLTVDKGVTWLGFAAPATGSATGMSNPMTTKGDLIVGGDGGAAQRLAIGTEGQIPVVTNGVLVYTTRGPVASPNVAVTGGLTLALANLGKTYLVNSSSAATITVPLQASVATPEDAEFNVVQRGAGQVTIAGESSDVLLRFPTGYNPKTAKQYSALTIKKMTTNEWLIVGNLEPSS